MCSTDCKGGISPSFFPIALQPIPRFVSAYHGDHWPAFKLSTMIIQRSWSFTNILSTTIIVQHAHRPTQPLVSIIMLDTCSLVITPDLPTVQNPLRVRVVSQSGSAYVTQRWTNVEPTFSLCDSNRPKSCATTLLSWSGTDVCCPDTRIDTHRHTYLHAHTHRHTHHRGELAGGVKIFQEQNVIKGSSCAHSHFNTSLIKL